MTDGESEQPARRRTCQSVRWSTEMRNRFFAHLTGNCNVTAAAETVGLRASQVYYRRKNSRTFAAHWTQAIDAAYQLLETRMIGHILAGGGPVLAEQAGGPEALDWDKALKLLTMHKARREDRVRTRKPVEVVATREQTDAAILAKLKALADRRDAAATPDEDDEAPETTDVAA